MPEPLFFCVLPGELSPLSSIVLEAGGVPVLDFTCSATRAVPDGAWVRVRTRRSVPGTGPVILAGSHKSPVRNRETWLEVTEPIPAPEGFAGIVLRGNEVGGAIGAETGLSLFSKLGRDQKVILDAGLTPSESASALAAGAYGVVLSDVLMALNEFSLNQALKHKIDRIDENSFHVVNGFQIVSSPLSPVLRRLLDGESFWALADGWYSTQDVASVAWPAGTGLLHASMMAKQYKTVGGVLGAYQSALQSPVEPAIHRPASSMIPPVEARVHNEPIAIIGLGCRLPGALSVESFWSNLIEGRSSITEVPKERWDWELFWDADKSVPDKTYAKIGGFLQEFKFNSRQFRIPPNVAKQVAIVQQITLESVGEALDDAGYGRDRDFDRTRVGVILGNSMGGEVTDDYVVRTRVPAFKKALESLPEFAGLDESTKSSILDGFEQQVKGSLPIINEDSMPGELSNVIAGRVANAFDLCGPNFTVDAACASSMAAIQAAVKSLQSRDVDMCVTGGADRSMGVPTYTKFCKIGALSPEHSAPFDERANGFVMGEGAGVLVLKRLSDARKDNDRIYAVIRGIGASSDGKGKGITAPNPRGQRLALERAYAAAGVDPVDVDLFECHGTSTVVGDKVEVESLTEVIGEGRRGNRGPIRIGSVKSNIGHLKSAAGAASCIKAALALHNRTFPPSINFENARSDVPFDKVPLQVQTRTESWPDGAPRRVGVSAFGFGGTNFHVVIEEDRPGALVPSVVESQTVVPSLQETPLPPSVWGVSAMDRSGLIAALESGGNAPFDPSAPVRLAAAAPDNQTKHEQIDRALKVLRKDGPIAMLRGRGIYIEETPSDGKVAFLFTGQGSQYINMGLDLAEIYPVVQATFDEADEVMTPELGRPLRDFILRNPEISEEEQFERLRDTEISQPATLTVDIALMRLLAAHGVYPDMVAGHSLGEYAAAVAAGILTFKDALIAVSARGREMASVQIEDKGRMAGIAASVEKVQEVLAEIPGYVVPANKNCATQTVIAGASGPVEAAIEAFQSRGITVFPLPVSHAFHSTIVAPASAPLKKVLERLDIQPPRRPITTNVTSRYYPTGDGAREQILETLAQQVAAPVEWIAQVERMYADGARIFVECGPKRALSGFVASILKRRPHRAIYTNHPKRGGIASFQDALAALTTLGFDIRAEVGSDVPDLFAEPPPRIATSETMRKWAPKPVEVEAVPGAHATPFILRAVLDVVADATGYSADELNLEDELEADLGIDTVKQAEVVAIVRDRFRLDHDPEFRLGDHRTLRDLANYAAIRLGTTQPAAIERVLGDTRVHARKMTGGAVGRHTGLASDALSALAEGAARAGLESGEAHDFASSILPAVQGLVETMVANRPVREVPSPAPIAAPTRESKPGGTSRSLPTVVCSGASVGLPGGTEVFAEDNIDRILQGEVRIQPLSEQDQDEFLAKSVVRLHKDPQTGQGTFQAVEKREEVIRLAGVKSAFDLAGSYGVDAGLIRALDITTQLAFAAGIEALRDAQIPLVQTFHTTRKGKKVSTGWKLPEEMRSTTGIVFASAFPGYDHFARHMANNGDDGEGRFDRRFLFQILSMGHSQFAQYIGAQGPNAQANAACASTTQAVAIASDWIQLGRCERVIIVGADDVTNETLLEWIGTGFLATGAATTTAEVEEAALPFDARRHGMILGMGAVGLVLESEEATSRRGIVPISRLLASRIANSAFHGTRLNPDHIAGEMDDLIEEAVQKADVDRATFATNAMFMSHETYTPAKGGSAAAEIESLRRAFGASASKVVVTNTKGFTGHPMGAGIEDAIVLKALQYGRVPPIPHLKEPDPDLGDLTLSPGGSMPLRYGIRLAAGFGSQLALLAWEGLADGDNRIGNKQKYQSWLSTISGHQNPEIVVQDRHLRVMEGEAAVVASSVAPVSAVDTPPAETPSSPASVSSAQVLEELLSVISTKTGYGLDELETDYELEADLGIDTVKQAEIFGQVREQYGLAPDENFRLADYPTIEALAGWLSDSISAQGGASVPSSTPVAKSAPSPVPAAAPAAEPAPAPAPAAVSSSGDVLADLLKVISEKTGYDESELETDYELEADLGIDTVKQAEIFGQVREQYGLAPDENFRLADYPTIEALAGWLSDSIAAQGGVSATAPTPAPVATSAPAPVAAPTEVPNAPAPVSASSGDVLADLLKVISEKTGYDESELDTDYELEADLGIDTVKQAEIFGQVREQYGLAPDENFRLADYPTIEALAGWLSDSIAAQASGEVRPVSKTAPASSEAPTVAADETTGQPETIVLPDESKLTPVPPTLPDSFRIRRPVVVSRPPWSMGSVRGRKIAILGEGAFADALRQRAEEKGAVLSDAPDAVIDAGASVFDVFTFAQGLDSNRPVDWVCAVSADRAAASMESGAKAGARAGFAKAIGREWEACAARVVYTHPDFDLSTSTALVLEELAAPDGSVEIFWNEQGRHAVELEVLDFPAQGGSLTEQVIVLTGGTRGITAEVALALAERGPCTLALMARTPPGEEPLDEASAKSMAKAALEAEGVRATPAAVRDRVAPLKRAEEARLNVERMRELGATVSFFPIDLSSPDAVKSALEDVRSKYGPIGGLVHGAGVEESRLIADKNEGAFHRVFDGKAVGGLALAENLESDAWFVSMGSVAGRFGNPGQVDYSAANEAMAQVCLARPRSLHVDWTAWADVGMAVRGGMDKLLGERGVEMLPAHGGSRLLLDMVSAGITGEVLVAGRLGDFGISPTHPLLDDLEMDGDVVTVRRSLSLKSDSWILDHAIDGKPVLPGVIGLELMASAATLAAPGHRYGGAKNVQYLSPVKLHGDAPTDVIVRATPVEGGARATLSSSRTTRTGRIIETDHFSADICWELGAHTPLPPMGLPDHPVSGSEIYRRFFHGPIFQVLTSATAATSDALMADGAVRHTSIAGGMLTIPLVLEAAFQAAGLHRMMVDGVMALPQAIESVSVLGSVRDDEVLKLTVRRDGSAYDVDVVGEQGPVMALRGFQMVEAGPLPPDNTFDPPEGGWSTAVIARVKASPATAEKAESLLTTSEKNQIGSRGNQKRQSDRTLGRVAAKQAVAELTGLNPEEFEIQNLESGEPVVVALDGGPVPKISISHRDGEAIAVATPTGRAGIDMERVESREISFSDTWFRPSEQKLCQGDARQESRVWAVKEAVLKVLGTGMRLDPREVEVLRMDQGHAEVRLWGSVQARHAALGGGEITIDLEDEQTMVIAVAWMAS